MFGGHSWSLTSSEKRPRMQLNILQCPGQPPAAKDHPSPNVHSAKMEKLWLTVRPLALITLEWKEVFPNNKSFLIIISPAILSPLIT